ncbi:hypothetical protein UFOVP577_7 [uncultured Caudovirales phage]|uniref:Uncharacterized protein n=1 Tax=uncultured Caudovirales phage TaxID=2100421 RepID=A0A6J5MZX2_9CAUD|nr:hypothetical protein UFOVP577_7 [uncultured Caudovirales phage]
MVGLAFPVIAGQVSVDIQAAEFPVGLAFPVIAAVALAAILEVALAAGLGSAVILAAEYLVTAEPMAQAALVVTAEAE